MKTKLVFFSIICVLLFNCGDGGSSSEVTNAETKTQKNPITEDAIENFEYKDYTLSIDSEVLVANWEKYQEFKIQLDNLKKADLSFFTGDKVFLKGFIDSFKVQIPDTLKTNHIISRTAVIETRIYRLNENLTLDNIDDKLKLESIEEILIAFSNLNYQINKKLVRDKNDKISSEY